MPLLRKLRYRFIENEQTVKYFKYAIGEIVLIVIGILIAVGINNFVSYQKDLNREKVLLENMMADLEEEIDGFESDFNNRYERKIKGLQLARLYATGQYEVKDTTTFLNTIGMGGANSRGSVQGSDATFQELVSSGNLNLISNADLRKTIQEYYRTRAFIEIYVENLRTDYANFINSVRPYDPARVYTDYPIPPGRLESKLQTPEFLDQTNQ